MQKQLLEHYDAFKNRIDFANDLSGELSAPLLLSIPDRWKKSNHRMLVIGQETMGWGFDPIHSWGDFKRMDNSVQTMVDGYRNFEFARHKPEHHNSPFWCAYRHFREVHGDEQDGVETSVLWTNLFRMSLDGCSIIKEGTSEEITQLADASRDVLLAELRVLGPTSVVFFTGPNYDRTIDAILPGLARHVVDGFDIRVLAQLVHADLPVKAWRTYHPAYLRRSKQWQVIDALANSISG